MAGAGRVGTAERLTAFFRETFTHSFVHVTSDLEVALEAAAGPAPGIILIAGTGSSAFGRNADGETARTGGHGPWIGDEGSAYDIGRRAIASLLRSRDCGNPLPILGERILTAAGSPSWDDLIELVAAGPDRVFPGTFPVVVEAAAEGEVIAQEILREAARNLGELVSTLIHRLKMENESFPLAKTGGVFEHSALLDANVDEFLRAAAPRAQITALQVSPAVGAARLALRLAAGRGSSGNAHGG
jgi:glucosamine kinase